MQLCNITLMCYKSNLCHSNPYPFFFQRIFGETAEKNLYLSQLIILDTLEKCLAGVSRLA